MASMLIILSALTMLIVGEDVEYPIASGINLYNHFGKLF